MRQPTAGHVFYSALFLGFLFTLYLENADFIVGMLAAVVLLVIALPLELVLSRRGVISPRAAFPTNSKIRTAAIIAAVILAAIVEFPRPTSTAPPDMLRDLSWLTAVCALYLVATALRGRLMAPEKRL
jgi:hypothetical protein